MRLPLDSLPENLEPTRTTLHAYALAVGAVPRVHAITHDKWWHSSLKVAVDGLATERMAFARGTFRLRMDLHRHEIVVETSTGGAQRFSMREGFTGTEMGDALIAAVAELGLEGDYARNKFAGDEPLVYEPEVASAFLGVLTNVEWTLATHRATLGGSVGPLQVWPHGFDLAFEWFGTKVERSEEHGETVAVPAQLNLGFYPRGDAYFYSNPWPFDAEALLGVALPSGAVWHTDGWQGSMLRYADVAGLPDAADRVLDYAKAVFDAASPTLAAR